MMNNSEFEQFVRENGRDLLRFCRMTCGDRDSGDELYQDTMLGLLGKRKQLDTGQNVKSYALSMSILLWKNKKKKYANRNRLLPVESIDCMENKSLQKAVCVLHIVLYMGCPAYPGTLQKQNKCEIFFIENSMRLSRKNLEAFLL